ncbi:MAG: flagellar brake protein [Burkholderiaceae bacterium]
METRPATLDAVADGLDEFRVAAPREIAAMLRQLLDGSVPLNLNASDGSSYTTTLWMLDAERGSIGFAADTGDTRLQALLECEEVVVVAYINNVKLQFDVNNLVLVHGSRASVLSCTLPREVFRFQRRGAFRVRPLPSSAPSARLRHPETDGTALALRLIDISIGGCALFLPDDVPAPRPGVVLERVEVDLDADTHFEANLRLQHVTAISAGARGVRLGCEFVRADATALRALQRFIDLTQKRGKLLSLN